MIVVKKETLLFKSKDEDKKKIEVIVKAENVCVGGNGVFFRRDKKGVIPTLLEKLYNERKKFKKDMLNVATINIMLEEAIEQELLQRIDSAQARTRFNYNGRLYAIGRNFI